MPPGSNPDAFGVRIGPQALESGETLPEATIAVQTWGRLAPDRANAVLVEHALTGDTHVIGAAGPGQPTAGWWPGVVGPGCAIDTDRYFVVATNALGGCRGSTGPSSPAPDGRPWGSRFPQISVRDQVAAEAQVADLLGINRWRLVVGGSMGGMRAAEWAASYPDRVQDTAVIASAGVAAADQIAWGQAQILAITGDPDYYGGDYYDRGVVPSHGLGLARRIAHTTYRSADELDRRFGVVEQAGEQPLRGGRFSVEGYLDHHAAKLVGRFDAGTYVALTRAMATHDIGRGRGGMAAALSSYDGGLHVIAVDSDRLFPVSLSEELVAAHGTGDVHVVRSPHGHDGFLIETDQIARALSTALG
ncbi:homoserine acetyltransferase [Luteipulveratus halotolerans]|uniref:Homoserine O-acetyltransferase n=1 Tax=Luteipulveratus halotolerans TaxID=1631356 RepID=A0A0L6CNF1_9MICO|nr:homoserine acetyltransferase [Luteipulveratus halotolerans]